MAKRKTSASKKTAKTAVDHSRPGRKSSAISVQNQENASKAAIGKSTRKKPKEKKSKSQASAAKNKASKTTKVKKPKAGRKKAASKGSRQTSGTRKRSSPRRSTKGERRVQTINDRSAAGEIIGRLKSESAVK